MPWFVGENGPLIAVSVIAGVLLIVSVILLIMLVKQRADIKRSYIFCFVSSTMLSCCYTSIMNFYGVLLSFISAEIPVSADKIFVILHSPM